MTELDTTEAVRLCALAAEAMGIAHEINTDSHGIEFVEIISARNPGNGGEYDPLTNCEQCLALVERFRLYIVPLSQNRWLAHTEGSNSTRFELQEDNLRRAIVVCVAKMQAAKS